MSSLTSSVGIVGYMALFATVGIVFLFVNLLVGRFLRPHDPHPEKLEIYECGEPTIGSSFVQFDLRFYVVALLFIIFDVEVAFFFPWAVVFGKANELAQVPAEELVQVSAAGDLTLTDTSYRLYREIGVPHPTVAGMGEATDAAELARQGGQTLALLTIVDILVFFAVLMVGFAYVWKRGDLNWVRAVSGERAGRSPPGREPARRHQPAAISV